MESSLTSITAWLEANSVLLGALGSLAAVLALFLVNGAQALGALFKRNEPQSSPDSLTDTHPPKLTSRNRHLDLAACPSPI